MDGVSGAQFQALLDVQQARHQQLLDSMMNNMQVTMKALIETVTKDKEGPKDKGKKFLDYKGFQRLNVFDNGEADWVEWDFDFRIAVSAQCDKVMKVLERSVEIAKTHGEQSFVNMEAGDKNTEHEPLYLGMAWSGPELFKHLIQLTSGEAKTIVRSVDECDGYAAYNKLKANYTKRTMGRMMRQLDECMYPAMVKDIRCLASVLHQATLGQTSHQARRGV